MNVNEQTEKLKRVVEDINRLEKIEQSINEIKQRLLDLESNHGERLLMLINIHDRLDQLELLSPKEIKIGGITYIRK